MKLFNIFAILASGLFFIGCASNDDATADAVEEAPAKSEKMGTRTAYDGSTGSGLLMERYKAGQIEGFRN